MTNLYRLAIITVLNQGPTPGKTFKVSYSVGRRIRNRLFRARLLVFLMGFNAIIFNVNLAFLLHIYQPPVQSNRTVEEITESSYLPLLKTIKNRSDLKLTLNIPLSLSYLLHSTEANEVISMIKEMFQEEKIELTSSGAYHPLLPKIPDFLIEREIILNERGLGYYYGRDKGFEGEDALMLRDVVGFFPPESAIDERVISILDQMGYNWVFVDDVAIAQDSNYSYNPVYEMDGWDIKIVDRHKGISNMLSFQRYSDIRDLTAQILYLRQEGKDVVLALDGEFFGHHYKDGIYLLETMLDEFDSLDIDLVTVKELIDDTDPVPLDKIRESSWGASYEEVEAGDPFPLWDEPDNDIQKMLWEILDKVAQDAKGDPGIELKGDLERFETFPLWDLNRLSELGDVKVKNEIFKNVLLLQSLHSDQFWWASNKDVGTKLLHKPTFVKKALSLYGKYATVAEKKELLAYIEDMSQKIESIL